MIDEDIKLKSSYVEYISAGVRYALKETGLKTFPESTHIIVFNKYHDLANFDMIIGFPILVTEISTPYDFCLAFNSEEQSNYKLLKEFDEFLNLFSLEEFEVK